MLLCFVAFFDLFGNTQQDRLVKDQFPGAQIWFEKMAQKYPVAQLDHVLFCISDIYLSRTNTIYWPESRLQAIDRAYNSKNQHDPENMFKHDEYLLLHEAAHVLKNHNQKGYVALTLTCAAFAALNGYIYVKAFQQDPTIFNKIKLSIEALLGNLVILTALAQYVQFQEHDADDFVNQYGDERSLQAGADWFMRLEKYMLKDQQYAELTKKLFIIYQDPWHPSPEIRYQKVLDALTSRQIHDAQA